MGFDAIRTAVTNGKRPEITDDMKAVYRGHLTLVDLISNCWDQDPLARPDFHTICTVFDSENSSTVTDTVTSTV